MKISCIFLTSISAAISIFLWSVSLINAATEGIPATTSNEGIAHAKRMPAIFPGELNDDVRNLMYYRPTGPLKAKYYRPLLRPPAISKYPTQHYYAPEFPSAPVPSAPAPAAILNLPGMSFNGQCTGGRCGGGWPPDPNGDVGPNHYIQAVNTAYAIYDKSGNLITSFTEDNLWSTDSTLCNGYSQGDPIVIYDPMADRWILTHFAFSSLNGPYYQCIAVSQSGDPVSGGWYLYPIQMDPGGAGLPPSGSMNDYPKFGIWPDCLYMSANEFSNGNNFAGTLAAAFSRSALESGGPVSPLIIFLPYPANNIFTMIPSNLRGASPSSLPPDGTPNYYVSESQTDFEFEVRTFNCTTGTFTTNPTLVSQAAYDTTFVNNPVIVPQPGTNNELDSIDDRLMQKVQYRRIENSESLWVVHNVTETKGSVTGQQWAQIDVTGGTITPTPLQQQIYSPDTTLYRWMGSLALDKDGNMALGYSTSSGTAPNYPSIAYAGRLSTDPLNNLSQSETQLIAGGGSQTNNCGSGPCSRWGDYTAMSVDPSDDCTFWYTNEYYDTDADGKAGNWQTRIGAFRFATCNPEDLVRTSTNSFAGIGTAYVSLSGADTLRIQAITFYESPVLDRVSVFLSGGYNTTFSDNSGFSAVHGSLTITGTGQAIVDKISIQ